MKKQLVLALALGFTLTACGDEEEEHGSIEEEGCEHMNEGPAVAVTAGAPESAPDVSAEHTRHDVTLVDGGGSVTYEAAEAGPYILFLDRAIGVTITGASGAVTTTAGGANDLCADAIPEHLEFDLAVGSYTITFGPSAETEVRMVLEHASEEGPGDE